MVDRPEDMEYNSQKPVTGPRTRQKWVREGSHGDDRNGDSLTYRNEWIRTYEKLSVQFSLNRGDTS